MSYAIELSRRAEKEILALPNPIFAKIRALLDQLIETPRPVGTRKLKGGRTTGGSESDGIGSSTP